MMLKKITTILNDNIVFWIVFSIGYVIYSTYSLKINQWEDILKLLFMMLAITCIGGTLIELLCLIIKERVSNKNNK